MDMWLIPIQLLSGLNSLLGGSLRIFLDYSAGLCEGPFCLGS